jgi:transcriptional regulator with XRE-family HTH domain
MRVRIKESSFCLRALRATLESFRMAAARSTLAHVPTTSSAASNCLTTADPVCNRDGDSETLDLRELPCRCNLEYRFAYADGKPLDRPRQLRCVEPAMSAVSSTSFISSHMIEISLGQRIHELRDRAGLSLRKLADQIGISSPFLSDIELGRRFPSEEILAKLAKALDVSPDELKQYDTRGPIADLKRLVDSDPKLGFAFRTVVEKIKNGELTAEDIIAKLSKRKSRA